MNNTLNLTSNEKKGKVVFMYENILEVGINHHDGYTTLYLDVHDMPFDLREKITNGDEETLDQLETYLDDYYNDAELDSVSLTRGEGWNNLHRWKEIFSCCGAFRSLVVKAKGKMFRLLNAI